MVDSSSFSWFKIFGGKEEKVKKLAGRAPIPLLGEIDLKEVVSGRGNGVVVWTSTVCPCLMFPPPISFSFSSCCFSLSLTLFLAPNCGLNLLLEGSIRLSSSSSWTLSSDGTSSPLRVSSLPDSAVVVIGLSSTV